MTIGAMDQSRKRVKKSYQKGSITVEASLIVPMVLILTVVAIVLITAEYEKALLTTYTDYLADAIANYGCNNPKYDYQSDSGAVGGRTVIANPFLKRVKRKSAGQDSYELYWRLYDDGDYGEEIRIFLTELAGKTIWLKIPETFSSSGNEVTLVDRRGNHFTVTAKKEQSFISSQIIVTTKIEYKIVGGSLLGVDYYPIELTSRSQVTDNAEFIRNYGLIKDMASRVPQIKKLFEGIEKTTGS